MSGGLNVPSNTTKKRGWQTAGVVKTGSPDSQIGLSADFGEPGYYTVQFNVIVERPNTNPTHDYVAEVVWSVEGGTIRRRLSIGSGTAISGTGQGVKVTVKNNLPNADVAADQNHTVFVQVSPGARPAGARPTLRNTSQRVILPAAGFILYNVPADSGVVSAEVVMADDLGTANVVVSQVGGIGVVLKEYNPIDYPGFVQLAPNCNGVQITNFGPDDVSVMLTWGIEG